MLNQETGNTHMPAPRSETVVSISKLIRNNYKDKAGETSSTGFTLITFSEKGAYADG